MNQELAVPPLSDRSTRLPSCVDDSQLQDVQGSTTPLMASSTARSVDRQGATSTIHLMVLERVLITSTPTMLMELPSLMALLGSISGHMLLDFLMMMVLG